ncbi:MAG: O-antigen ligase family protein [Bacteroidales bacterium]
MLSRIATALYPANLLKNRIFRTTLVYLVSLAFVAAHTYLVIKDKYVLALLPMGILVLLMAVYRFNWLFWIALFFVPLSVPLKEFLPDLGINMFLPTEPLLAGMMVIFILRLALDGGYDREVLRHPVTRIIILQLAWILVTTVTSSMPLVSLKFFLSRFWFLAAFYFIAIQLFKQDPGNIRRYLWTLIIPLTGIVVVITIKHLSLGLFDQKASNPAADPFFNDHTLYGAIMALFLPVAAGYLIRSPLRTWLKAGVLIVVLVLLTGLVFSYARASWVSVVAGIGTLLIILLKIPGKTVVLGIAVLAAGFLMFGKSILMHMEGNDQDSSDNLAEHVQSISNISTDASNLERLNRWSCALRMWADKPVFGFGPGTYMFQYAPYQKSSEKTIISTSSADGGNAHSEYLGPLSEMGVIGALLMLLLVIFSIITGVRVYHKQTVPEYKMIAIVLVVSLVTYFVHGILNNFLDTDKASAGVWGFLAILVALDLQKSKLPS